MLEINSVQSQALASFFMKDFFFFFIVIITLPKLWAASLVDQYFPMHSGDFRIYRDSYSHQSTFESFYSTSYNGRSVLSLTFRNGQNPYSGGGTWYLGHNNGAIALHGINNSWNLSLNSPVNIITDKALANNETITTAVKGILLGVTVDVKIQVIVSSVGTITVPAGTFNNCKQLLISVIVSGSGVANSILTYDSAAWCLAPRIGIIADGFAVWDPYMKRFTFYDLFGNYLDYLELLSGIINGVPISSIDFKSPVNTIISPANGSFQTANPALITGLASDSSFGGSGIAQITVNGKRAANDMATGNSTANWSASVNLTAGFNNITIVATDGADNSTTNLLTLISDTVKPLVSVVTPKANAKWNDETLTVSGTAKDSVGVANVSYSLNDGAWSPAITTNGWTNWTAQVKLVPGVNTLRTYARDTAGNVSITNSVSFTYVLTAPLKVLTAGKGTVSPNHNNAALQIGARYSMTAKAASGFGFTGWTGSIVTNSAKLNFIMTSNLTFTANFVDIAKPVVRVVTPKANAKTTNMVFTTTGTAKDNVGVADVFYSFNGSGWSNATTADGWTNWAATVTLTQRTNTLATYARDTAGNYSVTNTIKFIWAILSPLTVQTNGRGTVSPNYSNKQLENEVHYSITAKPSAGFGFVGWTGSIMTNSAKLNFIMTSNLTFTANFMDIAKPVVIVVTPKANAKTTNAVFTIAGTAKDNLSVANVFYSLNGSEWTNATTANSWSNWSAQVMLTPGANTLQVYAVDAAENRSTTNTVKCVFALNVPLTLQTVGNGTISPNYSNALLQIGTSYSITATPATGFKFIGWTGNTNTSAATLKFLMQSNLTFIATFTDSARPTINIVAPKANERFSNAVYSVTGTAKDNVGVANVFYSLNGSEWTNAITANVWSNWTAQVNLTPGANTLQVCAVDATGNLSTTNTVKFTYVPPTTASYVLETLPQDIKLELFSPVKESDGFSFYFSAPKNVSGYIQVSTNLLDWTHLIEFTTGTDTTFYVRDPEAVSHRQRFYRAVIP